jgi:TrmH family RNA methyltransferase
MNVRFVTCRDNAILKTMRLVASQSRKAPADLVLAEGVRTVEEAARSGHCSIVTLLYASDFGRGGREKALLDTCLRRQVQLFQAGEQIMRKFSDVVTRQGVIALVRLPSRTMARLEPRPNSLTLLASGVQDPGNLGTLIRTALAAGASLVCTTPGTVSARNPKSIRSSAGAIFHISLVEGVTPPEFSDFCRRFGIQAYRTSAKEGLPYYEASFRSSCAFLVGNEGSGLAEMPWQSLPCLRIPMASGVESLNVATAGAILLFEALRQRERGIAECGN